MVGKFTHLSVVVLVVLMAGVAMAQDHGVRCVSTLDYWQDAVDIQMIGNLAYAVSGSELHIVNLADPVHPVETGQGHWWECMWGSKVRVADNRAYVAAGFGVVVFDVSNPAQPARMAEWMPWGPGPECDDIYVRDSIGVVGFDGYFYTADVSHPNNMNILGSFPLFISPTSCVGIAGEHLFMRGSGLSVWSVSDLSLPVQVARIDTQFYVMDAAIAGNRAYLATEHDGVRIIDVSNPLVPVEVSACDSGECRAVVVNGVHAIVTKWRSLNIWNIANRAQPFLEGAFALQTGGVNFSSVSSLGNLVCAGVGGRYVPPLMILDITEPGAPIAVGTFGRKDYLWRMAIHGTVGYLAGNWVAVETVDLSDPTAISVLGHSHEALSDNSLDIAIRGDNAYTVDGNPGLSIFNISNPAQPESVAFCEQGTGLAERLTISGDYAYIIDGYNGSCFWLRTFNLANPVAPVCVDSLLITCYDSGTDGLAVANGHLYYGDDWTLRVYSLANPADPQLVGSCELPHVLEFHVSDLAVLDNYVYVAYADGGLRIVNVSNPAHPTEVGSVPESTLAVAAQGNTLITYGTNGLTVKSVTDRLNPVTVGYYTTDDGVRDINIYGSYVLTAGGSKFRVYECDALDNSRTPPERSPRTFALHPCYPNPFNPTTTIAYELPSNCLVRLDVLDVLGRRVQQFNYGMQNAGTHEICYNGSNLPTGIYFAKLEAGKSVQTQKLMLIR